MADLIVSCIVKRTSLALADLELETPGYCRVVTAGPGSRTIDATWVTSPHVQGSYPTSQKLANVTRPLVVRLQATNASDLGARTDELYQAFGQFTYELDLELNASAMRRWTCYMADITPGDSGTFQSQLLRNHYQEFRIDIPSHPIPLEGEI
jgi:hypothetical protein